MKSDPSSEVLANSDKCPLASDTRQIRLKGAEPRQSASKLAPAVQVLWNTAAASRAFLVDDRLLTLVARHLIGQLGTVIVSLLTNDLPFRHVYPLHINHFPFAALVFSAAVCSLKVSRSLYDAIFSRHSAPQRPRLLAAAPEQALSGPHANFCCIAAAPRTQGPPGCSASFQPVDIKQFWSLQKQNCGRGRKNLHLI